MDAPGHTSSLTRTLSASRITTALLVTVGLLTVACDSHAPTGPESQARSQSQAFSKAVGTSSAPASDFAVLANAAATCTDGTIVGDVGTFLAPPTGSVTLTDCPVTGAAHVGSESAKRAFNDFLEKYDALAAVECDEVLTGTLAGVTLDPGVYCFDAAATLTGVLTLDGPSNGSWLFKIGTEAPGALAGTSFSVEMAGGGEPCNVVWWVDAAATLTDSDLKGSILAGAAITLTRGTLEGNAWSQADATVTGTAVTGCEGTGGNGGDESKDRGPDKAGCNQGVGNGPEDCDPGNSNQGDDGRSNDENGGTPGSPGRDGGNGK